MQAGGHRFDPDTLHQFLAELMSRIESCVFAPLRGDTLHQFRDVGAVCCLIGLHAFGATRSSGSATLALHFCTCLEDHVSKPILVGLLI